MPRGRGGSAAAGAAVRATLEQARNRKPGCYLIRHFVEAMPTEERAFDMRAVHPADLAAIGMRREMFFHAHVTADMAAAAAAADAPRPVIGGPEVMDI
jgi:hypothetical protein